MEKTNQTRIEDLPVETKQAAEVKGGSIKVPDAPVKKHPDAGVKDIIAI